MIQVLLCGQCGGPLPRPDADARFVTCRFCEATSDLQTGERQASANPAPFAAFWARFKDDFDAFEKELRERFERGEAPLPAFRAAAESALPALIDPATLANVAFGITMEFWNKNHVDVSSDALAMGRIARAYLSSLEDLAAGKQISINLPFLTATPQGPLHYMQDVTMAELQQWAATPAAVPAKPPPPPPAPPAPPPPAPPADPPPAKTSWWKKMLG